MSNRVRLRSFSETSHSAEPPRGRGACWWTSNTANLWRSRHPLAFKPQNLSRKSAVKGVTVKLSGNVLEQRLLADSQPAQPIRTPSRLHLDPLAPLLCAIY